MPSKYTKLEENFGVFMNRSLVRFEFEKSPLHTVVYGGSGTGKTYFVRQYLKLYQNGEAPAQLDNMARMNCDTIYITIYNGADLLKNFNEAYNCKHDFHGIISQLINSYYNCTDGGADELRYGMIKYNKKEGTFIIIDRNRTMIYDSRIGFLDLKALSLKDKLESDEIHKLIAYMKPPWINATDSCC